MNQFPQEQYQSQGSLFTIRAFGQYFRRRIAIVALGLTESPQENAAKEIYEYAELSMEDARVCRSRWDNYKITGSLTEAQSEAAAVRNSDLALLKPFESDLPEVSDSLKGSLTIVVSNNPAAVEVLLASLKEFNPAALPNQTMTVQELSKRFGYSGTEQFHDIMKWGCHPGAPIDSPRQYSRAMECAGLIDTLLFEYGAKGFLKRLSPEFTASSDAQSNTVLKTNDHAPDGQKAPGNERVASQQSFSLTEWVASCVKEDLIKPAFSSAYLFDQLKKSKAIPDGAKITADAFSFELAFLLKSGTVPPAQIIHPKLFEEIQPFARIFKEKPKVRLTEVKELVDRLRKKPVDFLMIRAAMMLDGHPAYQAKMSQDASSGQSQSANKQRTATPGI